MDSEQWEKAKCSLTRALEAYPNMAPNLLDAVRYGSIDGGDHNAILKFLTDDDDADFVASGELARNTLSDIEEFVLDIIPEVDTSETNEKLTLIEEVLMHFIDTYSHELGPMPEGLGQLFE